MYKLQRTRDIATNIAIAKWQAGEVATVIVSKLERLSLRFVYCHYGRIDGVVNVSRIDHSTYRSECAELSDLIGAPLRGGEHNAWQ